MSKPVQRVNAIATTASTGRSRKNPKKTAAGAMNIAPARVLRGVGNATVVTSTGDAARLLRRLLHVVDAGIEVADGVEHGRATRREERGGAVEVERVGAGREEPGLLDALSRLRRLQEAPVRPLDRARLGLADRLVRRVGVRDHREPD